MTASIAISSAALAQSNTAIQIAKDAECKVTLNTYNSLKSPTIAEQREYAGCVYRIHGDGVPLSHEAVIFIKVIIVIMLISAIAGAWKEWETGYASIGEIFLLSILYSIMAVFAIGMFILVIFGISFLFQ